MDQGRNVARLPSPLTTCRQMACQVGSRAGGTPRRLTCRCGDGGGRPASAAQWVPANGLQSGTLVGVRQWGSNGKRCVHRKSLVGVRQSLVGVRQSGYRWWVSGSRWWVSGNHSRQSLVGVRQSGYRVYRVSGGCPPIGFWWVSANRVLVGVRQSGFSQTGIGGRPAGGRGQVPGSDCP